MQRAKLGISVGLLGAAIYFAGLFSGYLVAALLTGYVLLFEDNEWLRKSAVKAVALMIFFSFLTVLFNLVPNVIDFVNSVLGVFGGGLSTNALTRIIHVFVSAIDIVEKIIFLGLGIKALSQGTIVIPFIDSLVRKYMD